MAGFVGEAHTDLPAPSTTEAAAALVTHLHGDHTDVAAIARALAGGGPVLRPEEASGNGLETVATLHAETGLREAGLPTRVLEPWETAQIDEFTVTAVPAVDGFGDPQVSWVIEAGGRRIFHGGDTIFHGSWWLIAMRLGPLDAAFVPVNGAVCDFPHRQPPSPLAASMDPLQAATAVKVLGARVAVPVHYDAIHKPPVYSQVDDPPGAFGAAASRLGIESQILEPGETLEWRS